MDNFAAKIGFLYYTADEAVAQAYSKISYALRVKYSFLSSLFLINARLS